MPLGVLWQQLMLPRVAHAEDADVVWGPHGTLSLLSKLPAVVSLHGMTDAVQNEKPVIIDGLSGKVITNPAPATIRTYQHRRERYERLIQEHKALAPLPAETLDGRRVTLRANLEFMEETAMLEEYGAEGIGLLRTEMVMMMQGNLSMSEDQQTDLYRSAIRAAAPESTTFRLLDLGGDKMLPVAHREHNPFLGWRGIRVLLDKPDILTPQLRALLRASTAGPMRLLVPMVTTLDEVVQLKRRIQETREALVTEGYDVAEDVPFGVMVEVPAVALTARRFAGEVDFLSLGTNDLTQYTLAVDRGNDLVAALYHEVHPAVLHLIKETIDAAHEAGVPVSLCGELGANPRVTPLLVGLGLDEISASPSYLLEVKRVIRSIAFEDASMLAARALEASSAAEVEAILDNWLTEHACKPIEVS